MLETLLGLLGLAHAVCVNDTAWDAVYSGLTSGDGQEVPPSNELRDTMHAAVHGTMASVAAAGMLSGLVNGPQNSTPTSPERPSLPPVIRGGNDNDDFPGMYL
jgi:hypothetical protein